LTGPLLERADKAFFILKACALGHLLHRLAGSLKQLDGALASHFIFQDLQAGAFLFELPVQTARR